MQEKNRGQVTWLPTTVSKRGQSDEASEAVNNPCQMKQCLFIRRSRRDKFISKNASICGCLWRWLFWCLILWSEVSLTTRGWVIGDTRYRRSSHISYVKSTGDNDNESGNNGMSNVTLVRYRGRVAYDGSKFRGFQIQEGKKSMRTIQASLEEVLRTRFNRSSIRAVGAGRTDAGVSARGQAFHFDLTAEEHEKLQQLKHNKPQPPLDYVMNRMLTDEIRVWNVGPAPAPKEKTVVLNNPGGSQTKKTRRFAWNAIHDTTHKLYSYRICVGPVMDPIYRCQRWHVPSYKGKMVNITLLAHALSYYEKELDCRPFAGGMEQLERRAQRQVNTIRTIYSCQLADESDDYYGREGYYRIDFLLSGALYKMVRNMVGVAIDVSCGRIEESKFLQMMRHGEEEEDDGSSRQLTRKDNPSEPAPPEGLTLERVFYDDDDMF